MKPKVYITRILPKSATEKVQSFCDAKVWEGELPPSRDVLFQDVPEIESLLCLLTDKVDAELMNRA